MSEVADLRERLAMAERALVIFAATASRQQSDHDKAVHQAWSEWWGRYGWLAPPVTAAEVLELAARRDVIRSATLMRVRAKGLWTGCADDRRP